MDLFTGKRIAIANRGEIAVRIAATCRRLGAEPILLVGEPDRNSFAARRIGLVEVIGEAGSELDVARVVAAAKKVGADFLHPGYGFLSEHAELAEACEVAGIRFVGPSAATLRLCGDKLETRAAAERVGVAVLPASEPLGDAPDSWLASAREIGFPLLVKPAGAGGGRGLRHAADESGLVEAVRASRREVASAGLDARIYLERALVDPRHVEVQVVADGQQILVLGDRDCSVQRRHQKVIEEAPAPNIKPQARATLHDYAQRIAEATGLCGIATCEFLLSPDEQIAFLEVNPRIQVEHPVTELVTGVDLVEWQLLIAAGVGVPSRGPVEPRGHAIEARVYAEDPWNGFFPSPGRLGTVSWPTTSDIRVDAGYESGDAVPADYDAMLAKVIAYGSDRDSALATLQAALFDTIIGGLPTNLPWLINLLDDEHARAGRATTQTAVSVPPILPDRTPATIAAVASLIDRTTSPARDAWSAIGPWRASGSSAISLHGDDWVERVTVSRTRDGWVAVRDISPATMNWRRDESGLVTISDATNIQRFAVVEHDGELEVCGGGGRWLMHVGPRPAATVDRDRRSKNGRVSAPLPATVLGIHVEVGDEVAQDEPLVTLYAMKMEFVCAAPVAGIVETVRCRTSELVDADQVLVEIRDNTNPSLDSATSDQQATR